MLESTKEIDPYFSRGEISNSDLGELEKYFLEADHRGDIEAAYRFGTLIDAMITEPHRVDPYQRTVDAVTYSAEEWQLASNMKKKFMQHELCSQMLKVSTPQKVMSSTLEVQHGSHKILASVRCKWDLWMDALGYGGDIKSTVAETQQQFIDTCHYFNYDRQRAFYMDIAGSDKDILIGISKKNLKIFTLPIQRGDAFFTSGQEKYQSLLIRWDIIYNQFH